MGNEQPQKKKEGALWEKPTRAGGTFFTGYLLNEDGTERRVVAFPKRPDGNPDAPSLVIYEDTRKYEQDNQGAYPGDSERSGF